MCWGANCASWWAGRVEVEQLNEGANDLLAGLRDIHAAAEPGWWPPAPGWWLLGAAALVLLALGLRFLARRWSALRQRRRYLAALDALERNVDPAAQPREFLAQINRLFRAVALRAFPGRDSARLQGGEWVRFIRSRLPGAAATRGLEALASGPYQPQPEFDAQAVRAAARAWVQRHG